MESRNDVYTVQTKVEILHLKGAEKGVGRGRVISPESGSQWRSLSGMG